MLVVVLLPLFIGLTTVLLVKSITEIVWLSVLVLTLTLTPTQTQTQARTLTLTLTLTR